MTSGYSKIPLIGKLGIKPGFKIALIDAPEGYLAQLGDLPDGVSVDFGIAAPPYDWIQAFFRERADLETQFAALKTAIHKNGSLWISWRKGQSKNAAVLSENAVRDIGLMGGLVDVKVIAVDAEWSGLKFVYRLEDR